MVTDIKDNKTINLKQPVDITNFTDIDFTKVGDYKLCFTVSDDAGNRSEYQATLTITPTEKEQTTSAFDSTFVSYQQQVKQLKKYKLADQQEIGQMLKSIDHLIASDYVQYQDKIDQKTIELQAKYITNNDILLGTANDLIASDLALKEDDQVIISYQEELVEIDITIEDLEQQNKIYSRLTKIIDGLKTRNRELEIEVSGIPEQLYDNSFLQVTTCNYNINRNPNVKVDVGAGDREYYAYTNQFGQLAFITANQIVIQNESSETVNDDGEYCDEPAEVVRDNESQVSKTIISDSLGGASNSYNVIPVGNGYSQLEAIENEILANGGATDFQANLTYPSEDSHTPSLIEISYKIGSLTVEYTINN